jgi:transcriptional regulator with XRE-family HTH domain
MSALSVRTIQRIENGEQASLETLSALASVFEISVTQLCGEEKEANQSLDMQIANARKRIKQEMRFVQSLISAILLCLLLLVINHYFTPNNFWSGWVMMVFSIILVIRAVKIFFVYHWLEKWQNNRLQKLLRK